MTRDELVGALREFARTLEVSHRGHVRPWSDHTKVRRGGFVDEETLVQPKVFPAFAQRFLGWTVGTDLAAEFGGQDGTPDFTPDDRVTHPFVFETKGTAEQDALSGHDTQVARYLTSPHIERVVLTNMVAVRVFTAGQDGRPQEDYRFSLRGLWDTPHDVAVALPDAERFERFVAEFSRQQLTTDQKIARIRAASPWAGTEVTDPDWLRTRLARAVAAFEAEVRDRIDQGALLDPTVVTAAERAAIRSELQGLLVRFGVDVTEAEAETLDSILSSNVDSRRAARKQYVAHVAYWIATKLALVRIWEDLGLVSPASLYDGGFDTAMHQFNNMVEDVISGAFARAERRYRSLFAQQATYSWYRPSRTTAVNGLYELANTYMGEVSSDVLGEVYETMLQRIDRKLLGQYYTPRDVIRMMWDIAVDDDTRRHAETQGRALRTLDIATGSGGFLVEGIVRERQRADEQAAKGASLSKQEWINRVAAAYTGVEYQRFSAFLAELNLIIQVSQVLEDDPAMRVPELGVVNADTLTLHQPQLIDEVDTGDPDFDMAVSARPELARRIKDPGGTDHWFDLAVGNPPYLGEKGGAANLLSRLEARRPYWDQFRAAHRDYLYGFLIVGVSKLRPGGRFAFITTEYWLRATGAAPLRDYLAVHCQIDRLLLFRDLRLFPDAPGQHNLVVTGTRVTDDNDPAISPGPTRPLVSIYEGPNVARTDRSRVLAALRDGTNSSGVRSFRAAASPNELGDAPWIEVTLSKRQARRRRKVIERPQLASVETTEGVIATAQAVNNTLLDRMSAVARQTHPKGTGVFVLDPDEVAALGTLNATEKDVLRPMINTADVLPYAAVLPRDPEQILYLPVPDDTDRTRPPAHVINEPFPDGMPAIRGHLETFQPALSSLMQDKSSDSRYVRPWWTLHDDRKAAIGSPTDGRWAPFCVTSRWGGGGRLVVGLVPEGAVPKSGLHMLYSDGDAADRHAAYLCGIYNSDLYQQLTEAMAPGHTRSAEIEALGLPDIDPDVRDAIVSTVHTIADAVHTAASPGGVCGLFPQLRDVLREDVSLGSLPDAWAPTPGPATEWGTVSSVGWLTVKGTDGPQAKRVTGATIEDSLFGVILRLHHVGRYTERPPGPADRWRPPAPRQ